MRKPETPVKFRIVDNVVAYILNAIPVIGTPDASAIQSGKILWKTTFDMQHPLIFQKLRGQFVSHDRPSVNDVVYVIQLHPIQPAIFPSPTGSWHVKELAIRFASILPEELNDIISWFDRVTLSA